MSVDVHRSHERDPSARGREIGAWSKRQIRATGADYTWMFAAAGLGDGTPRRVAQSCLDELRAWSPALSAEVAGIAAGAGIAEWEAAALNARTEILVRGSIAGLSECSTAVWLPADEPPRAIQTWDWVPWAHDFRVLRHRSEAGLDVVTFGEHGVVGKLGVNSAGLGLMLTLLCHTSDGTASGVPVHAVARHILDTARSVPDAVDIALSARVAASASVTVLDLDGLQGRAATVELSPAGSAVLHPEGGYLLHTNHFLDPGLAHGDRLAAIGDDSLPRMDELRRRKTVLTGPSPTDWARGLICHWEDGAPLCAHPREDAPETNRWETKMLVSFDLGTPGLLLQEGGPCRATTDGWMGIAA